MANQSVHQKLIPGKVFHIYNRGNNRQDLFFEERNYAYFLSLWDKYISPVADTFAYCLLNNHFHFLIRVKREQDLAAIFPTKNLNTESDFSLLVSKSFSNLFNAYSKAINKSYKRTGSLFQERFRRKWIDSDAYFTEVIFYIHGNAQKHGLVDDFREYPYSSFHEILARPGGSFRQIGNQTQKEILEWFGGTEAFNHYHDQYREALIERKNFLEVIDDD